MALSPSFTFRVGFDAICNLLVPMYLVELNWLMIFALAGIVWKILADPRKQADKLENLENEVKNFKNDLKELKAERKADSFILSRMSKKLAFRNVMISSLHIELMSQSILISAQARAIETIKLKIDEQNITIETLKKETEDLKKDVGNLKADFSFLLRPMAVFHAAQIINQHLGGQDKDVDPSICECCFSG